jgi:dihydropteroate synthase
VLRAIGGRLPVPISVDTYKAEVARRAIDLGADIVNDVSGLQYDPDLSSVVAGTRAALILMHNRGRSAEMYAEATYSDVVAQVIAELRQAVDRASVAGIAAERIVVDPGLGFAKRAEHTVELLARFAELHGVGRPLLSGPSRKSFLATLHGDRVSPGDPVSSRIWGTAAAVTASILAGAHIVRVHDVREMVQVARVADACRGNRVSPDRA